MVSRLSRDESESHNSDVHVQLTESVQGHYAKQKSTDHIDVAGLQSTV